MKDYSFGNFISELRIRRGLSQFQLGTLVGVSNKAVSKWENGSAKPKISTCYKLAEALGISLNELLACKYHTSVPTEKGIFAMKKELWNNAYARLHAIYGNCPPIHVTGRFETEKNYLQSGDMIVHFGFLSHLIETTQSDPVPILPLGEINSSFVAWLLGITSVNPLYAHYYCPKCMKVELHPEYASGWDLPEKKCNCGCVMLREGHSISCESAFNKATRKRSFEIRIPISFQEKFQQILMEYFNDAAFVLKVEMQPSFSDHYVILPISAADELQSNTLKLTYSEYWDRFSDYPQYTVSTSQTMEMVHRMCLYTNHSVNKIDFCCEDVITRYSTGNLPCFLENSPTPIQPLLKQLSPSSFAEILQIYGLHHATGAWNSDIKSLISSETISLKDTIAFREDVYRCILQKMSSADIIGNGFALSISENVRKGSYARNGMSANIESALQSIQLPNWYIDNLKKIQYLFPKGHMIAILRIDMILLWFFLHYPETFTTISESLHFDFAN